MSQNLRRDTPIGNGLYSKKSDFNSIQKSFLSSYCVQSFGPGTEGLWRPEDTEDDLKELALKELAFK